MQFVTTFFFGRHAEEVFCTLAEHAAAFEDRRQSFARSEGPPEAAPIRWAWANIAMVFALVPKSLAGQVSAVFFPSRDPWSVGSWNQHAT